MTTLPAVNLKLMTLGIEERLARGDGYFYFCGGNSSTWPSTMVCVNSVRELTIPEWLGEYGRLKSEAQK